jgi:two-component system, sensor histidine kinase ChiS
VIRRVWRYFSDRKGAAFLGMLASVFFSVLCFVKIEGHAFMGNSINADFIDVGRGTSLESSPIIRIMQDQDGFIWFISKDGLVRYDGTSQRVYEIKRETGQNLDISSIDMDDSYHFWIGTEQGEIYTFDIKKAEFSKQDFEDVPKEAILSIFYGKNNALWLANQKVLFRIDEGTKKVEKMQIIEDQAITGSINGVRRIAEDNLGNICIGMDMGIIYYNVQQNAITPYLGFWDAPFSPVNAIEFDAENIGWIATDDGFYRFDQSNNKFIDYGSILGGENSIQGTKITDLAKASNGEVFIATNGEGLLRFSPKSLETEVYKYENTNPVSLRNNRVRTVFVDRDGNVWVGMDGEVNLIGVQKNLFNHTRRIEQRNSTLETNRVNAIAQDSMGNLWIGSHVGLNKREKENGVYTFYRNIDTDTQSLSNNHVTAITTDANGNVWIGTNNGLNRYIESRSEFERYFAGNSGIGLTGNNITALASDSKGLIYIGTNMGLNVLDDQKRSVVKISSTGNGRQDLTSTNIKTLYVDPSDTIWVGTDAGLNRVDPQTYQVTQYRYRSNTTNSLSNDLVNAISMDGDGVLWVGTADGVLQRMNGNQGEFIRYGSEQGILADMIYGILGHKDVLWISTNRGLFRFNTKSLQARRYTRDHGLQNNQFNQGATFANKENMMFFGGDNGFNSFQPEYLEDSYRVSPIAITNLTIDGLAVRPSDNIELNHKNNTITIEFGILDYSSPENNQYGYKLEGVDKDYIYPGNRNIASYSNLSPRNYTFSVIGQNYTGQWNDQATSFQIRVKPHPLKTWWAYTLYILMIVAGLIAYVKLKTSLQEKEIKKQRELLEELQKVDKMKDEFLANTSHELRTPLNGIIGITETLRDGFLGELPELAKNNVSVVLGSAKRLLRMVNDILDLAVMNRGGFSVDLVTVDFREVYEECYPSLKALAKKRGIDLLDNLENTELLTKGDPFRIQQVLFNIIGNAIKFTQKGYVEIGTIVRDTMIEVYVKDTGPGIPQEKLKNIFEEFVQVDASNTKSAGGTGLGLAITKNLVQLMGGSISVESRIGMGSTFTFTLPRGSKNEKSIAMKSRVQSFTQFVDEDFEMKDVVVGNSIQITQSAEGAGEGYQYKVLIVDDEPVNRVDLNNRFSREGNFVIFNASDGVEAIEMIEKEENIDLVLMDVMMPRMSGIEACRKIRKKYSHYELPILMLTAKNQPKDMIEGFSAGANDYLTKPFDREVLSARSKNLLGLRRAVQKAIESAKNLKTEKQRREFSEMLARLTNEMSEKLNTGKIVNILIQKLKEYFGFEKMVGLMILEDGFQMVNKPQDIEDEEILASILEQKEHPLIQELSKTEQGRKFAQSIEIVRNEGVKSSLKWMHFPIRYHNKLHGVLMIHEGREALRDDYKKDILDVIISHAAASIENAKLYSRVKTLATVDALTGLNNRRFFFEKGVKEFRNSVKEQTEYGVIMMDIDNFKKINDNYGHGVGDQTLKKLGEVLRTLSNKSTILGRFGGEEFIVAGKSGDQVLRLAEKIRKTVETIEIQVDSYLSIHFTVSIGVSFRLKSDKDIYDIIKRADVNLYKAKNSGKNRVVFDEKALV